MEEKAVAIDESDKREGVDGGWGGGGEKQLSQWSGALLGTVKEDCRFLRCRKWPRNPSKWAAQTNKNGSRAKARRVCLAKCDSFAPFWYFPARSIAASQTIRGGGRDPSLHRKSKVLHCVSMRHSA